MPIKNRLFKPAFYSQLGWFLLLAMLANFLVGCGESATPTVKPSAKQGDFPVAINPKLAELPASTLKVWFASDYYNEPPIVDLMKEFRQAYPNVTIEIDHTEWGKMRNKVRDAVGSGTMPDVAHQHAFVFGAQGFAEPLNAYWDAWGKDALASFMPGSLDDASWNNVKYGVPLDINALFLIYNKQMFKEAGLPEPDSNYTYTKLLEDARKLTKPDGSRYGLALKQGGWDVYGLVRSNGGDLIQEQGLRPLSKLDAPANSQMLQFLSDVVNKEKVGILSNSSRVPEPVELFKQRKIAMFFSGPWDLKILEKGAADIYAEVGTATLPRGFDGTTTGSVQGGGSLFIPKGAKNKDFAFEFMKWAASPKYQLRLAREMGRYPVISELYKDPFFTDQPLLKPYLEQLKSARPYKLEAYTVADVTWEQTIVSVFNGNEAKSSLVDANRAVQAAINAAKP